MSAGTIPANIYPLLFLSPFEYSIINMCFHEYVWMLVSECLVSEVISHVRCRAQVAFNWINKGIFPNNSWLCLFFSQQQLRNFDQKN